MSKEGLYFERAERFLTCFTKGGYDRWGFDNEYWIEWQGDCQRDCEPPSPKTPLVLPEEYLT